MCPPEFYDWSMLFFFKIEFITITTKFAIIKYSIGKTEVFSQQSRVQYSLCYFTTVKADVIPGGALSYFLFSLNAVGPTSQLRIPTPLDIKIPQVHDDGHLCTRASIIRGHFDGIPFSNEKKPVGHQVTHEQSPNLDKGSPLTQGCLDGLHATHCVYSPWLFFKSSFWNATCDHFWQNPKAPTSSALIQTYFNDDAKHNSQRGDISRILEPSAISV